MKTKFEAFTNSKIKNNVSPKLKLKFNNTSIEPFVIKKMTPIKEIKIPIHWMKFNRS